VAGLYIRKGTRMAAVQHGGDHERRRRAGTENVAGLVGFGKAVEVRGREMGGEAVRLAMGQRAMGRPSRPGRWRRLS